MCSTVVWNCLCSCPSTRPPESGPSLTLGQSSHPRILPQQSGTEQSTGSCQAAFPTFDHLPMAALPGELLHQEGTNTVLAVLYFHQQHDVTAGNDLQGEGAGGSLHTPGLGGLGRVRKKWLQRFHGGSPLRKKWHAAWGGGRGAGNGAFLLSELLQSPAGTEREPGAQEFRI